MDEIKQAEKELLEKAAKERKAHMSSREYAIELAAAFYQEMVQAHALTLHSVQTVIKTTDGKGNVHTSVLNGMMSYSPGEGSVVVYSNIRSRRERTDKIRRIIWETEDIIDKLKKGGPVPDDLKTRFAKLKESIPDRNDRELISKPKSNK